MGVMCSLFGHDYGGPDVERERNEEGTEVVLRAKRIERCRNCGHERTIAENTEVTALSAAAGVVREPDGTVVVPPDDTTTDGSAAVDDESAGPKPLGARGEIAGSGAAAGSEAASGNGSPSIAGGSIADAVTATSALSRPTADSMRATADEPESANPPIETEPAVDRIRDGPTPDDLADDPVRDDRPHRAPGEWPAEPERAPRAVHDGGTNETTFGDGSRHDAGGETVGGGASPRAGGSFACSSCGFGAVVADSPLRAGDICPGCGVGYLALETRKG